VTGVDKDLATLLDELNASESAREQPWVAHTALARVEAELSRLREQRDEAERRASVHEVERGKNAEWAGRMGERAEAAEARCARLQQALEHIESLWINSDRRPPAWWDIAREALAGPDTSAARCPICTHEWRRHDPEDGKCDAGSDDFGECPCGRDAAYHRVRNAALSKAALLVDAGPDTPADPVCPCGHRASQHPIVWHVAGDASTSCQAEGCRCLDYDGPDLDTPADSPVPHPICTENEACGCDWHYWRCPKHHDYGLLADSQEDKT
jgi:hypothetical protein